MNIYEGIMQGLKEAIAYNESKVNVESKEELQNQENENKCTLCENSWLLYTFVHIIKVQIEICCIPVLPN